MSVFWPKKNRFFFDFLASPGAPGGSQTKNSENYIFTMKKIDFYEKLIFTKGKPETRESMASETTW